MTVHPPRQLAGARPLIDVHAHFLTPFANRMDWHQRNMSRLHAGARMGVRCHVASVLGSWGHESPVYFAAPDDQTRANTWMYDFADANDGSPRGTVRAYAAVNPNFASHALAEIARGVARGAIGVKLAAARRADDALLDDVAYMAAAHGLPVLHHVWQHRRRDWPNQDASDGIDLARLAARHPGTTFILAHIGGGGDYTHSYAAVAEHTNIVMDLSGSGIDRGMLDGALASVGADRLLWASDLTMCTGLTKLRALAHVGLSPHEMQAICWDNAMRIFPSSAFVGLSQLRAGGDRAGE